MDVGEQLVRRKTATRKSTSATRLTQRVPWLCVLPCERFTLSTVAEGILVSSPHDVNEGRDFLLARQPFGNGSATLSIVSGLAEAEGFPTDVLMELVLQPSTPPIRRVQLRS